MNHADKTIPYRLSPAELENLRMLRRRTQPSHSSQADEAEEKMSEEINAWNSGPRPANQKVERIIP
jgi:hypothetical protein